jgi:hypothetical protein
MLSVGRKTHQRSPEVVWYAQHLFAVILHYTGTFISPLHFPFRLFPSDLPIYFVLLPLHFEFPSCCFAFPLFSSLLYFFHPAHIS